MVKKKTEMIVPVGKKIKQFRIQKKIALSNLANDTGCSVDYLKQLEAGKVMPPVGTLLQISRALQIDSGILFKEQTSKLQSRIKAYNKRTDNYAYTTLTPGAENKHIKAFRVAVEGNSEHTGVGYQHEGEEFVYVLKGEIEVVVGDNINSLAEGESLHFNSGIQHKLRNVSPETAEFLVVIYGP